MAVRLQPQVNPIPFHKDTLNAVFICLGLHSILGNLQMLLE